jgi:nuclear pore complex protein Nup205
VKLSQLVSWPGFVPNRFNFIDVGLALGYHNSCLTLLLRIAQIRAGAISLYNCGIFSAIRHSEIFSTDPDIGFGILPLHHPSQSNTLELDNPEAHQRFFDLMLSVLRIVNAIVLNYRTDHTLASAREFLMENRQSVVGILKRFARVGGINADGGIDLSDLVDNLSLLISATDFLAVSLSSTSLF